MFQYSNDPAFIELKREYQTINVVDVGAARAAFIVELNKFYDRDHIHSLGVDPMNHGVEFNYNRFYNVCVDDIPQGTQTQTVFYIRGEDQCSSLCEMHNENITSNPLDSDKFYVNPGVINRVKQIVDIINIPVLNVVDLINEEFGTDLIHFIKIDCEGKDINIVKSLEPIFHRIKYIAVECPNRVQRYKDETLLNNCLEYFKLHGFEVFYHKDYEFEKDNGSQASDVVFVNKNV
jgi:hypothetical protein